MTKRTRTILFVCIVFLFLVAGPSAVFYAQGYRVNFTSKKVVQTGGMEIKVWPKTAEVYLNEGLKKKTDFLFGRAFIDNLLPKTYAVRVSKDGYFDWLKELEIKEKQLTIAQNIILIPKDAGFVKSEDEIQGFWPSPDGKKALLQKMGMKRLLIEVLDLQQNNQIKSFSLPASGTILNVQWSDDTQTALLKLVGAKYNSFYVLDLSQEKPISIALPNKEIQEIVFHPLEKQKALVSFSAGYKIYPSLLEYNWQKKIAGDEIISDAVAFSVTKDGIVWLSSQGHLYFSDLSGTIRDSLNTEPFLINRGARYKIVAQNPQKILLLEGQNLFFFSPEMKELERVGDSVQNTTFSPDYKKAAWSSGHELWIVYLEKQEYQPQKNLGERALITRLAEPIQQVSWLGENYLVFTTNSKINPAPFGGPEKYGAKIAEIDDRDGINIVELPYPTTTEQIFFNPSDKKLYLVAEGKLFTSEKQLAP